MTKGGKQQPKPEAGKKPRVQKETVKDLDPKGAADDVKGGVRVRSLKCVTNDCTAV